MRTLIRRCLCVVVALVAGACPNYFRPDRDAGPGRSVAHAGQQCDVPDSAGCVNNVVAPGWVCAETCEPVRGDGLIVGTEQCDDGNADANDGCAIGSVEPGWTCTGEPSRCTGLGGSSSSAVNSSGTQASSSGLGASSSGRSSSEGAADAGPTPDAGPDCTSCPEPLHASPICTSSGCGRGPCEPGWFDLDGPQGILGCEASCDGTICVLGNGSSITLSARPLPETGLVASTLASGASLAQDVQTGAGFVNIGVLGESTPPGKNSLGEGPVQRGQQYRNQAGFTAVTGQR